MISLHVFVAVIVFHSITVHADSQQTSTNHYELCKAFVSELTDDVCSEPCIKIERNNGAPSKWSKDCQLNSEALSEQNQTNVLVESMKEQNNKCNVLSYCATYMHLCKACGTPSVWHPSDFIGEDGRIRLHPSHKIPKASEMTSHKRVYNGFKPIVNSMPWSVLIHIAYLRDGVILGSTCGGTLIDSTTVLTAAHCTNDDTMTHWDLTFGFSEKVSVDQFAEYRNLYIRTSTTTTTADTKHCDEDIGVQYRRVLPAQNIVHERYQDIYRSTTNDVAILKLNEPVQFSHAVSPACLPEEFDPETHSYGNRRFVAGAWGISENGHRNEFRQIAVQQRSKAPFNPHVISVSHELNDDDMEKLRNMCGGDSGSGLMDLENGSWFVAGVASRVNKNCTEINKNSYTDYLNVPYYVDWIEKHTENGSDTSTEMM